MWALGGRGVGGGGGGGVGVSPGVCFLLFLCVLFVRELGVHLFKGLR